MAVRQLSDGQPDGTSLGQSSTDKISFYGATPIAQGSHVADATDAATAISQLNLVIAALENSGILATS